MTAAGNAGITLFGAMPGRPLNEVLAGEEALNAAAATGRALREFHRAAPTHCRIRTGPWGIKALERWVAGASHFYPKRFANAGALLHKVRQLLIANLTARVVSHRDLSDKHVFYRSAGSVGLIDVDTIALGEAAVDLAISWSRSICGCFKEGIRLRRRRT